MTCQHQAPAALPGRTNHCIHCLGSWEGTGVGMAFGGRKNPANSTDTIDSAKWFRMGWIQFVFPQESKPKCCNCHCFDFPLWVPRGLSNLYYKSPFFPC